mgnify:FL=1
MRNYRSEYDNYHAKPKQKKRRAQRNTARSKMQKQGRVSKGDGKDVHHKDSNTANNSRSNLAVRSRSSNRSRNRTLLA